jgi:hypothetical protein
VPRKVEQDDAFLAFFLCRQRFIDDRGDRVRGLRGGQDAFRFEEQRRGVEDLLRG